MITSVQKWVNARIKERTTLDGAIAYGAWTIWKSE